MKTEKPEGLSCYINSVFSESTQCPDLDDSVTMEPKCRKFGIELEWTVSGHILKCNECLESEQ